MSELAIKARELADEILVDYGRDATDSPRFRLHVANVAAKIEQALLAERRLAMEAAISIVQSERVGDSTEPDRAYNMALEHACHSLRHAVATPRGGE